MGYTFLRVKRSVEYVLNDENMYHFPFYSFDELNEFIVSLNVNKQYSSFKDERIESLFEIEPRCLLQLFAQNQNNLDKNVTWGLEDVVDGGYISYDQMIGSNKKKVLIATEGKTDKDILSKSFDRLFPEIADLFYFFDYSDDDNSNINGCNELYKFCKSISQIKHSYVIALFDNDVNGNNALRKTKQIKNLSNLLPIRLPDRPEFEHFKIQSPWQDDLYKNINGKAVAIENFLDFNSISEKTEIKKENNNGQGFLCNKELYQEMFDKAADNNLLTTEQYDTSKLEDLITYLVNSWINYLKRN